MKNALRSILTALLLVCMVMGCSTLDVRLANGTRAEIKRYFTNLEISEATIIPNADGSITVEIKGLKSDISAAMEAVNKAIEKIPTN